MPSQPYSLLRNQTTESQSTISCDLPCCSKAFELIWKIPDDVKSSKLKDLNETSRRINRSLWNHLTIDAIKHTEFDFVKKKKHSNLVCTQYLWNHWILSIPKKYQTEQINDLAYNIANAPEGPEAAVQRLNKDFSLVNNFFTFTRMAIVFFVYSVLESPYKWSYDNNTNSNRKMLSFNSFFHWAGIIIQARYNIINSKEVLIDAIMLITINLEPFEGRISMDHYPFNPCKYTNLYYQQLLGNYNDTFYCSNSNHFFTTCVNSDDAAFPARFKVQCENIFSLVINF